MRFSPSLPGLTRQSRATDCGARRLLDARVKPGHDEMGQLPMHGLIASRVGPLIAHRRANAKAALPCPLRLAENRKGLLTN